MHRASVVAVYLLATATYAAVWRMPLQRRLVENDSPAAQAGHRVLQSLPYSWRTPIASEAESDAHPRVWTPLFPSPQATEDVAFVDTLETGPRGCEIFAAEVLIGTPPQPLSLAIDVVTGDVIALNHKLKGHAYYDHAKSTTYIANGTRVSFAETNGFLSRDHVTVGSIKIKHQFLTELVGPDEKLSKFPVKFDGEIGLGPSSALTSGGTPSLVRTMIDQNLLDRPVVGLHVGDKGAHVLFGGIEATYSDKDIVYFPHYTGEPFGWWSRVDSVSVDGKPITSTSTSYPAVITLSSLMGAPRDQAMALADAVGSALQFLPCDGPGPDITLQLGMLTVTLTKKDYTIPLTNGECMFAIMPVPQEAGWILGMPFLRHVYAVLDFSSEGDERLGLASIRP